MIYCARCVRLITNASGQVEQSTSYTPYGDPQTDNNITPTTPEEHSFIGERFDTSTGLLFLNARYYDPALGRFMQPDWWEVRRRGVGTNRYAYSVNDPINNSDRNGHGWISKVWKLITTKGDVAATTAGMVEDATTIVSPTSTGWQRAGATVSLASEYLPISVRDAKAIGRGTARGWRWLLGYANPIDIATGLQRTSGIRSRLNIGKGRTVAFAETSIDGVDGQIVGVSGRHSFGVEIDGARVARANDLDDFNALHAETKILENLRENLEHDSTGTISLFVDHPSNAGVCDYCVITIEQFRLDFPEIDLVVTTN